MNRTQRTLVESLVAHLEGREPPGEHEDDLEDDLELVVADEAVTTG